MHPIVLLIVLVAVLAFVSWYKRTPKSQQKKITSRGLLIGGGILLLVLLLTGRLHPLFAALAALVPLAHRALGLLQIANTVKVFRNQFKAAQGPTPGQASAVDTRFVRMTLNHDSGEMDGEVIEGPHRGRLLSALAFEEILELLSHCRIEDAQSAAVLEAYLDHVHGDEWRERASGGGASSGAPGSDTMTANEACQILGVACGATHQEIIEAHRRLMQKVHPDRGGSTYLAAKLNQAKALLLDA